LDAYTLELQNHGLESVEREVRWLEELIAQERRTTDLGGPTKRRSAAAQARTGAPVRPAEREGNQSR
jgi:hypothetical protein